MLNPSPNLLRVVGALSIGVAMYYYSATGDKLSVSEHLVFSLSLGVSMGFLLLQNASIGRLRTQLAELQQRLAKIERKGGE